MKKFAIIQKDKTILVKTPIPYFTDSYQNEDSEELKEIRNGFEEDVKFLNNCLKVLNISKAEAQKQDYTLNKHTGERLGNIAFENQLISCEFFKLINKYDKILSIDK